MLRTKDILDEKDPRVRAKNTDVDFPLNDEYKDIIPEMLKHLRYSQIEKLSKKYDGFELKNINIELPKGTVITNIPEEFIQQILGFVAI